MSLADLQRQQQELDEKAHRIREQTKMLERIHRIAAEIEALELQVVSKKAELYKALKKARQDVPELSLEQLGQAAGMTRARVHQLTR